MWRIEAERVGTIVDTEKKRDREKEREKCLE